MISKVGRKLYGDEEYSLLTSPFIQPLNDVKWFYNIKNYKLILPVLSLFTSKYMNFITGEPAARDATPLKKEKRLDEYFFTSAKDEGKKLDNEKDDIKEAILTSARSQAKRTNSPRFIVKTNQSDDAIFVEIIEDDEAPNGVSTGALIKRTEVNRMRAGQLDTQNIHMKESKVNTERIDLSTYQKISGRVLPATTENQAHIKANSNINIDTSNIHKVKRETDLKFSKEHNLENYYKTKDPTGVLPQVEMNHENVLRSSIIDIPEDL